MERGESAGSDAERRRQRQGGKGEERRYRQAVANDVDDADTNEAVGVAEIAAHYAAQIDHELLAERGVEPVLLAQPALELRVAGTVAQHGADRIARHQPTCDEGEHD